MGGKAKPTKHTAKQIQGKHHAAKMKAGGCGGGVNGMAKRVAPKQGKKDVYIKCEKCFTMQPSLKSMQIHYENKHPKDSWEEAIKLYNKDEQEQTEKHQNKYQPNYEEQFNDEGNENEDQKKQQEKEQKTD